jgi:hypothetical protein
MKKKPQVEMVADTVLEKVAEGFAADGIGVGV